MRHGGYSHGTCASATPRPISRPTPPRARSGSTSGWAIPGASSSRTPRTSRRSAPPSSATWPSSSRTSTSATSRSSASASTRSTAMAAGPRTSRRRRATAPNFPMIGDPDLKVSKLYDMLPAASRRQLRGPHRRRQPDRPHRLRHRPGQEDQADDRLSDDRPAGTSTRSSASSIRSSSPPSTRCRRRRTGSRART